MPAYASASDVAALCRNLLGPEPNFSDATSPNQAQISAWISSGCAVINANLASRNYGAIPQTSVAWDMARDINALYAAWMAERSRTLTRVTNDERTRADMFKRDFNDQLQQMMRLDFSTLGVIQTGGVYAGGISAADKDRQESDTDRVAPRFVRGMGRDESLPGPGAVVDSDPQTHDET